MRGPTVKKPNAKFSRMKAKALKKKYDALEAYLPVCFKSWLHYARRDIAAAQGEPCEYPEGTPEYDEQQKQRMQLDKPVRDTETVTEVKVPADVKRLNQLSSGLKTTHRFCAMDLLAVDDYPAEDLPEFTLAHLHLPDDFAMDSLSVLLDNVMLWGSSDELTVLVPFFVCF